MFVIHFYLDLKNTLNVDSNVIVVTEILQTLREHSELGPVSLNFLGAFRVT